MSESEDDFGYSKFCVPDSWVLEKFSVVFESISTNEKKLKQSQYLKEGALPVVDQGEGLIGGYTDDSSRVIKVSSPMIGFGDHTRKFKFINFNFVPGADGLKVLKPILIDEKFSYYACLAMRFPNKGYSRHFGYLNKSDFPLAPLNEQRRIVEKIEELFSDIDAGESALKKAQTLIKQYRQSLLKAAFMGELTKEWREKNKCKLEPADKLLARILDARHKAFNGRGKYKEPVVPDTTSLPDLPEKWAWCGIDHIAAYHRNAIKAGPFGSSLKKEMYTKNGYKIYGQEQVISGDWDCGDYFINEEKFSELANCSVEPNDILISLVGTVGKVLILPEEAKRGIINPRLIKITPNLSVYHPLLFKYYFESYFLKQIYSVETHGATMDVLNLGIIRSLPFPLCSLAEQKEIASILEEKFSILDAFQNNYSRDAARYSSLRQSILKTAFSGQLVPQDPKDEPASALLERIKAERVGEDHKSKKSMLRPRKRAAK